MKKMMMVGGAVALSVLLSAPVSAATIGAGVSGGWVEGWTLGDGGDYWDNPSFDNAPGPCNIGYFLTGNLGGCSSYSGVSESPNLPIGHGYWGNPDGSAVGDIWFDREGSQVATLILEIAGMRDQNVFGYYQKGNPLNQIDLFLGAASPVTTLPTFVPLYEQFGFFIRSGANTYYSESSLNSGTEQGFQHFVFFKGLIDGQFFIGVEDQPVNPQSVGVGDRDYNDMAIRIQRGVPVPEPATTMLLGLGLLGMATVIRRRR